VRDSRQVLGPRAAILRSVEEVETQLEVVELQTGTPGALTV
jgi:hypothetical protein